MPSALLPCASLLLVVLLVPAGFAQAFTESHTSRQDDGSPESTFVVDVNEVNVYFNVHRGKQLVQGLTAADFEIAEDKRPQKIRYFSSDAQEPLSLAILVDSSTSQSAVLQKQQEVGKRFLDEILKEGDEALVVGFDASIQMQQDFSTDRHRLVDAMSRSSLGTTGRTEFLDPGARPQGRSTALFDTIVSVSRQRMANRQGQKAMVILTDGQDIGSKVPLRDAMEAAVRADTICYVLLVVDRNLLHSSMYKGIEMMNELAKETGGRVIIVGGKPGRLEESLSEVAWEMRHHYTLAYSPDRKEKHGEYRKIQLKSRHGYKVQARKGYYAIERKPPQTAAMR